MKDTNTLHVNEREYYLLDEDMLKTLCTDRLDDNYLILSVDIRKSTLEMLKNHSISDEEYEEDCKKRWNIFDKFLAMKHYAHLTLQSAYSLSNSKIGVVKQSYIVFPFTNFNGIRQEVDRDVFFEDILHIAHVNNQEFVLSKFPKQNAKCLNPFGDTVMDLEMTRFEDICNEYFNVIKRYELFFDKESDVHVDYNGTYMNLSEIDKDPQIEDSGYKFDIDSDMGEGNNRYESHHESTLLCCDDTV